jgi:hypothetical protein
MNSRDTSPTYMSPRGGVVQFMAPDPESLATVLSRTISPKKQVANCIPWILESTYGSSMPLPGKTEG